MNEKLSRRLFNFKWKDCITKIKINDAIIKTLTEIGELLDCGIISNEDFIRLGKELWMDS